MTEVLFDTNNTTILINGNVLNDTASDSYITATFPNDQMGHLTGMNGGRALKTFVAGNDVNVDIIVIKGSASDEYLQSFLNASNIMSKSFTINITETFYRDGIERKRFVRGELAYIRKQPDTSVNGTSTDDIPITFNITVPNATVSY